MRNYRYAWIAMLAILAMPHLTRADDAVGDFRAVRVLIWGVDTRTGAGKGFAEAEVPLGKSATLKPDVGFPFVWTNLAPSNDGEPVMSYTLEAPKIKFNGTQSLVSPGIVPVFHSVDGTVRYVVVTLPVGSLKSPALEKFSRTTLLGQKAELEDMLLSIAQDRALGAKQLVSVYSILLTSQRVSEWVKLAEDRDADVAAVGLAVAARVGDAASLDRFCEKCLAAKAIDDQIQLANLLMEMPANQKVLDSMLLMAAGCEVTRSELARTIQKSYPLPEIHSRDDALISKASARADAELGARLSDVVVRIDRFAAGGTPPPRSNDGVTLEERMRIRREEQAATQPARGR